MKHIRHHYLDGFNEAGLLDGDEIEFSLIGKRPDTRHRPKRHASAPAAKRRPGFDHRARILRRARNKAWGMPY